jgi:hypothetical protein
MSKKKKKKKKAKKAGAIKVILMPDEETAEEEDIDDVEEDEDEEEEEESGMYLEKEDIQLLYNALKNYTPIGDEDVLHSTLLESFEETLVVDYGVRLPGFEFMDEEEN